MTKRIKKLTFIWLAVVLVALLIVIRTDCGGSASAEVCTQETNILVAFLALFPGVLLLILWGTYFLRWVWKVTNPSQAKEVK
jgi:hypothetical protein